MIVQERDEIKILAAADIRHLVYQIAIDMEVGDTGPTLFLGVEIAA